MTSNSPTPFSRKIGFSAFLATQFLGALNDNISKLLVICHGTRVLGASSSAGTTFTALAAGMFILPFLLCSSLAGFLADRYNKRQMLIWCKAAEIVAMGLGLLLALSHTLYGMIFVLFLMGAQSAFFSPAKYGFLPETHSPQELPKANGMTQLWTFLAIILGGYGGGQLSAHYSDNLAGGFVWCVVLAIMGYAVSFAITPTPPGNPDCKFTTKDPIMPHVRTLRKIAQDKILFAAVLGNSFFWFIGTIVQLLIISLCKDTLHGNDTLVGNMQGVIALGIGIGCSMAGCCAKGHITYRWVAPGALAMTAASLCLAFFGHILVCAYVFIALLGFSSGFFQLPLSTAIQARSPIDQRGRYLGACNFSDCIAMLLASLFLWLCQSVCHLRATAVLGILGILMAIAALIFFNCYNRKHVHD